MSLRASAVLKEMNEIPSLTATVTPTLSPDYCIPTMTNIPHLVTSTQQPLKFLSRPHLQTHGNFGSGFEDWETRITLLELYVLVLSMIVLVLFLAWLALLGLDILRPEFRGQARHCKKALRYLAERGDRLKGKDVEAEIEPGQISSVSKKENAVGLDQRSTEKGALKGKQLGLNEPRRRNAV